MRRLPEQNFESVLLPKSESPRFRRRFRKFSYKISAPNIGVQSAPLRIFSSSERGVCLKPISAILGMNYETFMKPVHQTHCSGRSPKEPFYRKEFEHTHTQNRYQGDPQRDSTPCCATTSGRPQARSGLTVFQSAISVASDSL